MNKEEFKSNPLIGLCIYIAGFFIIGSIILMIIAQIYGSMNGFTQLEILNAISYGSEIEKLNKIASGVNVISNALIYILLCVSLIFVLYEYLKKDALKIKENPRKFIIKTIVFAVLFYAFVLFLDFISSQFVESVSENQVTIENAFKYKKYAIIMFIITVFFGPLVEELVFRKCIFELFKKFNFIIPLIISTLAFALPHMISTSASPKDWLLMALPYVGSGLALGLIYKYSDENIYVSLFAHFVNNLVSVIIIMA